MRGLFVIGVVLSLTTSAGADPLERLAERTGAWTATFAGKGTPATIELVAGGKAVMQRSNFVAVFYADGADLMVMLFPDDGTPTRLRARAPKADATKLTFTFVDAANLKPGQGHAAGLVVDLSQPDRVVETWTWKSGKKSESFDVALTRR